LFNKFVSLIDFGVNESHNTLNKIKKCGF